MYSLEKLKVTFYEEIAKLPDPFLFDDGTRAATADDWRRRRTELVRTAVEMQYGKLPPEPEFLDVETLLYKGPGGVDNYRIITGTREHPVSFIMQLYRPSTSEKCPVVIDGDGCWKNGPSNYASMFLENGIMLAVFNRVEIVPDVRGLDRTAAIQLAYPDSDFSTTTAWAWGYWRVTDALIKLGVVDEDHIVYTGLSRGAKSALVAGAVDERAWLVNPEAPCAGGSLYRSRMRGIMDNGQEFRSEEFEDITANFPDWFSPVMQEYRGRVPELPFDEHYLKALVAPRIYFDSEAKSDIWAGPIQAYQSDIAALEVYKFLGVPENMLWYWRDGGHAQTAEDYGMLINLIRNRLYGEPLSEKFGYIPFDEPESIFDWKAPEAL